MSSPFIEENDQTRARREHLAAIKELVGNAYPSKFRRTNLTRSKEGEDTITSVVETFGGLAPASADGGRPSAEAVQGASDEIKRLAGGNPTVRVAGRLATPPRVMGKAAFVHLSDGRSRLQIYVRRQDVRAVSNDSGRPVEEAESGWKLFQLLDQGDFVGVEGPLFVTKTGELSVHVEQLQFLSKALVPMPDKLHGISDPEIRQRQRYADLIASSLKVEREAGELTTREVFERRSRMITELRRHLEAHGYVEVETPILSPIASGAAAKPFETYHNALDIKLYARIAPELYLKRLLVGGFERVYELNRNFRNEGISYKHNPEFTMLEFYCAYMDADGMMDFCEEMLRRTVQEATGGTVVYFDNEEIDFGVRFTRLSMRDAINRYWPEEWRVLDGEEFNTSWLQDVQRARLLYIFCRTMIHKLPQEKEDVWKSVKSGVIGKSDLRLGPTEEATLGFLIEDLFSEVAEPKLTQPTFITDFPKPISPLSKASPDNQAIAERFELYIMGMECANGFSELNDPAEQYERFEEQMRQRERGDEEAMQMDVDYVRALSYGMPPAAGIGIGIDRLAMLLTNRRSIRDVILFPHMRPRPSAAAEPENPERHREDSEDDA